MIVFPNAKINIGLNIIERRQDGYHNIETLMYPIPWSDVLEIVPANGDETTLTVSGRQVNCPPEKNLVMKACREFQREKGVGNVDIYLHKIIPDGAGLGGGSADAAFTLVAMNELFECNCSKEELAAMAAKIGADCPFFIYNNPCFATGIGTEFAPANLNLSGTTIAIIKPQEGVSTAQAYAGVTPRLPEKSLEQLINMPIKQWQGVVKNDFEDSIFPILPSIKAIKTKLLSMGAIYASMSGSGSAVYGLFPESDILADDLRKAFPGCDTFVGQLQ